MYMKQSPYQLHPQQFLSSSSSFYIILCSTCVYVTGYGKTDHFAHNFKIELLVFKGSVDLKQ